MAIALSRGAFDLSLPEPIYVETEEQGRWWLQYMLWAHSQRGSLGLDSETTGRDVHKDWVVLWSLSDGVQRICIDGNLIPIFKDTLLENPNINFDFSEAKFDAWMFWNTGVDLSKAGRWRDTTVQSWLLNENNLGRHGLKECIEDHFHRKTPKFEDVFGHIPPKKKGKIQLTSGDLIRAAMADPVRRAKAIDYSSLDSYNTFKLREYFDQRLSEIVAIPPTGMTLKDYFHAVASPYTKVLWKMERRGITVDGGYFQSIAPTLRAEMVEIEKEFAKSAGRIINLQSAPQLRWFFFDLCKRESLHETKGGKSGVKQHSVDEDVLTEWAGQGDPYSRMVLHHRGLAKIVGTYIDGLSDHIDHNSRIHTTLLQHGTVTGRLSSKQPNLQNIPRAGEDKYKIREAFIAGAHKILMIADYEQLEMRLMAHFSGDRKMIDAIRRGIDIHCLTVHELYDIPYEEVVAAKKADKKFKDGKLGRDLTEREIHLVLLRQQCKAAGFGIIYGIGGELLAANLTRESGVYMSPEKGKELIQRWLSVFPGVRQFIESTKVGILINGYVQTLVGRFRRFGDLRGMNRNDAARCERQGVNAVIQGTAADVAMASMLVIDEDPTMADLDAEMLLQIHDEIIFELPDVPEVKERAKARAKEIMEHPFSMPLEVELPVDVSFGYTWASK